MRIDIPKDPHTFSVDSIWWLPDVSQTNTLSNLLSTFGLILFFYRQCDNKKALFSHAHVCVINRFSSNFPTCVSVGYISIMYLSETRMNLRKFIWPWMRVCSNAGHRLRYGNLGPTHTHTALRASLQAIKYKVRSYCLSFSSLETHIDSIIFYKLVRFN